WASFILPTFFLFPSVRYFTGDGGKETSAWTSASPPPSATRARGDGVQSAHRCRDDVVESAGEWASLLPSARSLCFNGVVYFRSWVGSSKRAEAVMVAVDVHEESFKKIQLHRDAPSDVNSSSLAKLGGCLVIAKFVQVQQEPRLSF
ncbi:unnamed protein product, partial [Linum tenue]